MFATERDGTTQNEKGVVRTRPLFYFDLEQVISHAWLPVPANLLRIVASSALISCIRAHRLSLGYELPDHSLTGVATGEEIANGGGLFSHEQERQRLCACAGGKNPRLFRFCAFGFALLIVFDAIRERTLECFSLSVLAAPFWGRPQSLLGEPKRNTASNWESEGLPELQTPPVAREA